MFLTVVLTALSVAVLARTTLKRRRKLLAHYRLIRAEAEDNVETQEETDETIRSLVDVRRVILGMTIAMGMICAGLIVVQTIVIMNDAGVEPQFVKWIEGGHSVDALINDGTYMSER